MRHTAALIAAIGICASSAPAGAEPLDLSDTSSRQIEVELESSTSPGVVGVSYGAPVLATYSASGGIGTVTIPVASHAQMRAGTLTPIPGSFTAVQIQIDLGDLGATSQTASGALQGPSHAVAFTQQPLGTDTVAGYVIVEGVEGYCASQQQVDDECEVNPAFCGATCIIVPGDVYDPGTGKVNLVGIETAEICTTSGCFGPFTLFAKGGDLRLSESDAPVVPALPPAAQLVLIAGLLLGGGATLARRRAGGA